jgi:ferrous iron transport protein A
VGCNDLVDEGILPEACEHRSRRLLDRALSLVRPLGRPARHPGPAAAGVVSLDQLARGQGGRILRVGGRSAARRRLLELGVVRGEVITLVRAAPLGDPLEYLVKGYHLSLRRREAAGITVEALPTLGSPSSGAGGKALA